MPASLSKPQIRLIQTINECSISTDNDKTEAKKFNTLYLLSKSSFYIANFEDSDTPISTDIANGKDITLKFLDKGENLTCKGSAEIIKKDHEDYEFASDFFTVNPSKIDHIIEFTIEAIK